MSFHSKKCIRRKKEMCKVIAIANQKGGVGKTTTTVNLGIGLARKGKRVVLIDADPQGSMTVSLGIDEPDKIEYSLANVLMDVVNEEEIDYAKIILKHEENIDFIPANIELAGLEVSMVNVMSRELVMKRFISNIKEHTLHQCKTILLFPFLANPIPKLTVVVVFPTPPFWFAIAITLHICFFLLIHFLE